MVMGPTHAASGAAAWLLTAPTLTAAVTTHTMHPTQAFVGAAVCAGSALLPDIDLPSSTVSRSFGPATKILSYGVNGASKAFVTATSGSRDSLEHGGHRTLTHTGLFAVGLGFLVSSLCATVGSPAVIGVLFFTLGLALRGLMGDWAKEQGWLGVTAVSLIAAFITARAMPHDGWWFLGIAVAMGCLLHDLGDMITKQGAPLTAPFYGRIGKRWYEWTTRPFAITAGGWAEWAIINPICWGATLLGALNVISPGSVGDIITHIAG